MYIPNIEQAIIEELHRLTETQQAYLLGFIKSMLPEKDKDSSKLLRFAGLISQNDLNKMQLSIQEDCGNIDINEW